MNQILLPLIKNFLDEHYIRGQPILLGFSGGPDSLALLHLLLECFEGKALNLHLAHVDHGWRKESGQQAEVLSQYARRLGLPFHLNVLKPAEKEEVNLEAKGREARLKFFFEIYEKINFQGLLLGHHQNDQAETVLKRIFESGNPLSLGGLKEICLIKEMPIWRPLLKVPKKILLEYLRQRNLIPIDDPTNRSLKFLRSRMRVEIFPELEKKFGKNISFSLSRLGNASQELADYLQKKIAFLWSSIIIGPFGSMIDFTPFFPLEKVELDFFLKAWGHKKGVVLTQPIIDKICGAIFKKNPNYQAYQKGCSFFVDRGRLFWIDQHIPSFSFPYPLKSQIFQQEGWEWSISINKRNEKGIFSSWEDVWQGRSVAFIPEGEYYLSPVEPFLLYPRSSPLRSWWNECRIPALLRKAWPIIIEEKRVIHEFLTGKSIVERQQNLLMISIEIKKLN